MCVCVCVCVRTAPGVCVCLCPLLQVCVCVSIYRSISNLGCLRKTFSSLSHVFSANVSEILVYGWIGSKAEFDVCLLCSG